MMRFAYASGTAPSRPYPTSRRSFRSFFATTRMTPSSVPLRPTFHASATRIEYWSIASGAVVGTTSTAIWLPLRASKSASRRSRSAICSALSVPVRSVTRAFSAGMGARSWAAANAAQRSSSTPPRSARERRTKAVACTAPRVEVPRPTAAPASPQAPRVPRLFLPAEVHLGRGLDLALVLDREVGLGLVAEDHGRQIHRKFADQHVVLLDRLDVAVARHTDAVLRALELRLQLEKVLVRLELRILLDDHEQARQRARQFALRLLEPLHSRGIVQHVRRDLDLADARARLGHLDEHVFLLLRETLHRLDQVRDQVRAALILVHHLRPGGGHPFVLALDLVVAATGKRERSHYGDCGPEFLHRNLPPYGCERSGLQRGGASSTVSVPIVARAKHKSSHAFALSGRLRNRYAGW